LRFEIGDSKGATVKHTRGERRIDTRTAKHLNKVLDRARTA
jgi:hypothetical protein